MRHRAGRPARARGRRSATSPLGDHDEVDRGAQTGGRLEGAASGGLHEVHGFEASLPVELHARPGQHGQAGVDGHGRTLPGRASHRRRGATEPAAAAPPPLAAGPPPDVPTAAGDLVGLHASDPVTVYLAAAARVDGLKVADVERALYEESAPVLRMLGMRRTLFVLPVDLAPVVHAACTRRHAPSTSGGGWVQARGAGWCGRGRLPVGRAGQPGHR